MSLWFWRLCWPHQQSTHTRDDTIVICSVSLVISLRTEFTMSFSKLSSTRKASPIVSMSSRSFDFTFSSMHVYFEDPTIIKFSTALSRTLWRPKLRRIICTCMQWKRLALAGESGDIGRIMKRLRTCTRRLRRRWERLRVTAISLLGIRSITKDTFERQLFIH